MYSLFRSLFAAAPLALLASFAPLSPVRAQTQAVTFAPGFTGIESSASTEGVDSYNLGFTFSVNAPVVVTQLGYFADPSYTPPTARPAGSQEYQYATSHDVGLYNSSGLLLLSGPSRRPTRFRATSASPRRPCPASCSCRA